MKIRTLVVLLITTSLATLSGPAQERDGSVTFTDSSNQAITISRYGAVLSFRNSKGQEIVPGNAYRVCLCGEKGPCIESTTALTDETISKFEVVFPRQGTTLKNGQTLIVRATSGQKDLMVERKLTWLAGSGTAEANDAISSSKSLCFCTFEEKTLKVLEMKKMCPRPPWYLPCPPESKSQPDDVQKLMTIKSAYDFSKL